ncbi:class 1b ribonucleoside-diphosphate reductase subunit alpha [Thermoactinomyces sp. DSM 45892]|uniref:class 1b ribonucleoside-diphosphate reductase subunit alpha n=1 Tax=Thermoactinomyces sp. DSM 45892 TaxID=1882753 RepID=UPI00089BC5A2|nr:class 1b ribonucleoside-diphosphate reductase subunit alpha [Thermoactinomyces sp. DSM 45892]SDX93562.1 ribonucleoside-diphosphate reductase class Ib alpha subunit [Thermoactinomyces sp. DSM 45892]
MSNYIQLNNEVKVLKNGFFQLEKDQEAVKSYFINYINKNTVFFHDLKEKLDYLIENDYYDSSVFEPYTYEQIKEIYDMSYAKKFRFPSFMSAFKFYNNYALKTNDGEKILERYEDRISINALFLADGDFEKAKELVNVLINQEYQPATPTFLNSGRKRGGRMVSCFLLDCPDTTEGIMYVVQSCAQLSRFGGGVGVNLSKLRGSGDPIKGIEGASTSVVGIAKILEDTFSKFNQLGQRSGSGVVYLNIFHSDIEDFLSTKNINVDEKKRLKTLSIGVIVPNKFFEIAEKNEPFFVFQPYSIYKKYGIHLDEMNMDEWYEKLINDADVKKRKLDAREMLTLIAKTQLASGYPYFMYRDNANQNHHLSEVAPIRMSNLCTEIFQVQTPSDIQGYSGIDRFGYDISCNLGSLNLVSIVEHNSIEQSVKLGIDALTTVAEKTSITEVPSIKNANDDMRSIGLGVMNWHGLLAKNQMAYGSKESIELADILGMMIRFYSLQRSMEIAKQKGEAFQHFNQSLYAQGKGLENYTEQDFNPTTEKVQSLMEDIYVPTVQDWKQLISDIQRYGLYHSYLNAIAPTGSISYIQNATSGLMPITEHVETRVYADSTTHYPMPFLSPETFWFYRTAYDMDMYDMIDVIATWQKHIDQGISCTLFVNSDISTKELSRLYIYGHKKGLKSLYYTRTRNLEAQDCVSCTI